MTAPQRNGVPKSDFWNWVRNNQNLDSRKHGLSITDVDVCIHQYKRNADAVGERDINSVMFLEEKTFCRERPFAQKDTMTVVQQVLEQPLRGEQPARYTVKNERGKDVMALYYGWHVIQFSETYPDNSAGIWWDGKPIEVPELEEVLRFDRSPITRRRISYRRHHTEPKLELFDCHSME